MSDYPEEVTFHVFGLPAPQGSKSKGRGGQLYESSKKLPAWRKAVRAAAEDARVQFGDCPVEVVMRFYFTPPKRPKFRVHAVKPDGDKLARAVFDALTTSGMIHDDARVSDHRVSKRYSDTAGATITVRRKE